MNVPKKLSKVTGYTDIHAHFVYGVDDGAQSELEMYAMLDAAYKDGITALYATPHMTPGYKPFPYSLFQEHYAQAVAYCSRKQYALRLYRGAELLYTPSMQRHIDEQRLITMGDSEHVLVEFSPRITYPELRKAVVSMEHEGYVPVLAHVERYDCLFNGRTLFKLKEHHNVRCQFNANTLLSKQGMVRKFIIDGWFRNGLIDYVSSDAHNTTSRPFRMRQAENALMKSCSTEYVVKLLQHGI